MSQQRGVRKSHKEKAGAKGIIKGKGRNNSRWIEWSVVLNVVEGQYKINNGRKASTWCDYKDAGSDFCSESPNVG